MATIGIIIGSVREPRRGESVAHWVSQQAQDQPIRYELIDLRKFDLPHYNEPGSPRTSNGYVHETTRRWSNTIKQLDGVIFVTPEYNGYFPGAIKDAVDYLYHEWTAKPFAIVGYGGRGAKWASEHLATLLKRFEMNHLGYVGLHKPWEAIDDQYHVDETYLDGSLSAVFDAFAQTLTNQ